MQRFISTASLSILTAIAIVVYASDQSPPMSQAAGVEPPASPDAEQLHSSDSAVDAAEDTSISVGYHLENDRDATEKNDLLALVPGQFLNCDVGLWSHTFLHDQ